MGLGAYLAAVTDRDHYLAEQQRERDEVRDSPDDERAEIFEIMQKYGVSTEASQPLVDALAADTDKWVQVCILDIVGRGKC